MKTNPSSHDTVNNIQNNSAWQPWNINTIKRNKNNTHKLTTTADMIASVKHAYTNRTTDRLLRCDTAKLDDPSVYAKRSFPWSTVNTRQTPRRVAESLASRRDICRRGNTTNTAAHTANRRNSASQGQGVRRIVVRGSMPTCRWRQRKFDYKMVHAEVYLNKYVVSIAPFSTPIGPDCSQNIT